ncbi:MAG: hypothetical protein RBS57_16320 [Desulforhabdus sp.]|jgi:hypothetical protein|nr:hypothetical protein [Desulforhabdus sp.]
MQQNNEAQPGRIVSDRRNKLLRGMLIIVIVLCFSSCSTFGDKQKSLKDLKTAVEGFNTALRWGDYKTASVFVAPSLQEQFWQQADIMENRIRVTDYDIRNVSMPATGESFPVIIRFHYYITNDPHLQTRTVRQQWLYSEGSESWTTTQSGLDALLDR